MPGKIWKILVTLKIYTFSKSIPTFLRQLWYDLYHHRLRLIFDFIKTEYYSMKSFGLPLLYLMFIRLTHISVVSSFLCSDNISKFAYLFTCEICLFIVLGYSEWNFYENSCACILMENVSIFLGSIIRSRIAKS